MTEVVTDVHRRAAMAATLLDDPILREVLTAVRAEQIALFLNGAPPDELVKGQAVVAALDMVEARLRSIVNDKAVFDRQQRKAAPR